MLRINLLSCRVSFVYYRRRCVHYTAKRRYLRALKYECSPVDPDRPFFRSGFYKPPRSTATDAFGRWPARRTRLMYYARSPWLPVPPIRTPLQVTWVLAFNRYGLSMYYESLCSSPTFSLSPTVSVQTVYLVLSLKPETGYRS